MVVPVGRAASTPSVECSGGSTLSPGAGRGLITLAATYPSLVHPSSDHRSWSLDRLRALLDEVAVIDLLDLESGAPGDCGIDSLADAEVVIAAALPSWLLDAAPSLRWAQLVTTGVDHLDVGALRRAGLRITTAAGTSAVEIAEFVVARILEHWKRLPELDAAQRRREWRPLWGRSLAGTTAVLVGYGPINRELARRLAVFGVEIVIVRRTPDAESPAAARVVPLAELDRVLADADIVVSALPAAPSTVGLFDRRRFAAMRQGAFFCNVGRGSAVVEEDFCAALDEGSLSGAAVDVTQHEPLPVDDPLWQSTVRISPHCSTVPAVAIHRVYDLVQENLGRYRTGSPMLNELP